MRNGREKIRQKKDWSTRKKFQCIVKKKKWKQIEMKEDKENE